MSDDLRDAALLAIEAACAAVEKIPPGGVIEPWDAADWHLLGALLELVGVHDEWDARRARLLTELLS